jgi:hypothetical protein
MIMQYDLLNKKLSKISRITFLLDIFRRKQNMNASKYADNNDEEIFLEPTLENPVMQPNQTILQINPNVEIKYSFTSDKVDDINTPLTDEEDVGMLENILWDNESNKLFKYRPYAPYIVTYSNIKFNPTNPVIDSIVIEDIAHSLSMKCRFGGHSSDFYSVAQHSVLVSYLCDFKDSLSGLLHDGSEAYLIDLVRPLKDSGKFNEFVKYENKLQACIFKKFGLEEKMPESVIRADNLLLATEASNFTNWLSYHHKIFSEKPLPIKIEPLLPKEAKKLFLRRFSELNRAYV